MSAVQKHYLPAGLPQPRTRNDNLDTPYWEGAREHRLLVQRCRDCHLFQWGPEWICHHCFSFSLEWAEVEPAGTIFSWERAWHPANQALTGHTPYVIVLVDVTGAPGVRMVGNLLGDPLQDIVIGSPVRAVFEDHDNFTLVQWATPSSDAT